MSGADLCKVLPRHASADRQARANSRRQTLPRGPTATCHPGVAPDLPSCPDRRTPERVVEIFKGCFFLHLLRPSLLLLVLLCLLLVAALLIVPFRVSLPHFSLSRFL